MVMVMLPLCYWLTIVGCVWERKGGRCEAGGEAAMIGTRRENGNELKSGALSREYS